LVNAARSEKILNEIRGGGERLGIEISNEGAVCLTRESPGLGDFIFS
jgi:hypothetical protein